MTREKRLGIPQINNNIGSHDIRAHKYTYGETGFQQKGIRRRIRQGVGGPTSLTVGAEVEGHYHIGDGSGLNVGDQIMISFGKENWMVEITSCSDLAGTMVVQEGEDEDGYEISGKCLMKLN